MSNPMSLDDMHPGVYVTVSRWHDDAGATIDKSDYVGSVLCIVHIEIPFIVVNLLSPYVKGLTRVALDYRRCELMAISDEFVKAVTGRPAVLPDTVTNPPKECS
jgi:hypothetical protein